MKIKLEFKWQDMWVGAYWERVYRAGITCTVLRKEFHLWICVVPCLPIHIWWEMK